MDFVGYSRFIRTQSHQVSTLNLIKTISQPQHMRTCIMYAPKVLYLSPSWCLSVHGCQILLAPLPHSDKEAGKHWNADCCSDNI